MAHVVLSPGSRSTALSVAVTQVAGLTWSMHLDERSAAFAALGRSMASGMPVGLVCTSGTAAANYLPAVAEASHSRLPLVIVTADRPPEHQAWGVGQSFDQIGLFHGQVRDQIVMPVGADGGLDHAVRTGVRSTVTASSAQGPVHVNWPFRLPLEPTSDLPVVPKSTVHVPAPPQPTNSEVDDVISLVANNPRGVIVAGPRSLPVGETRNGVRRALVEFAEATGWPILADVLSGLRGSSSAVVDVADHILDSPELADVDLVLRVGTTPTAKSTRLWWQGLDLAEHVLLDPFSAWQDPSHNVGHYFASDPSSLLGRARPEAVTDPDWLARWVSHGVRARAALDEQLAKAGPWTEIHLAVELSRLLSPDQILFASSSLPIRDLDSFGAAATQIDVVSNRGINGIDGVVATAIGVAQARSAARVVVYIGDVALLHDIGSVLDAVRQGIDLTIVTPNNDGGGLFSFLPIRDVLDGPAYDQLFHTPHGSDFAFLDAATGIAHRRVDELTFANEFEAASARPGVTVLEATVRTSERMELQAALDSAARAANR